MDEELEHDPGFASGAYLTASEPGIGGEIKQRCEDFIVEELPLYEPSGEGEHIYLMVEKRDLTTMDLARLVARHFGVQRGAIGLAGMKDKRAVTRQVVSVHVPGKKIEDYPPIERDDVRVLWADYHSNKLRRGHLVGNRFSVRVRGVPMAGALPALRVLRQLERDGVPNRIGEQRFGYLGNNHEVGAALFAGRADVAVGLILGPHARSPEWQRSAREAFAAGDFEAALGAFPRSLETERRLLGELSRGRAPERAWRAVDPIVRSYYASAFQSAVFNAVLDARLAAGTLAQVSADDLAVREHGRVAFRPKPEELADGTLAAAVREVAVSATGPMWGPQMPRAGGPVDEAEVAALAAFGMTPEGLSNAVDGKLEATQGTRRALRVKLGSPEVEGGLDEHGPYVRCAFDLPRGSFATTVMREVMKPTV